MDRKTARLVPIWQDLEASQVNSCPPQVLEYKIEILYLRRSCNTGTSGLPDMYTQRAAGPRAEGVHIRQATTAM